MTAYYPVPHEFEAKEARAMLRARFARSPKARATWLFLARWHRWRLARLGLALGNGSNPRARRLAMGNLNRASAAMRAAWADLQTVKGA